MELLTVSGRVSQLLKCLGRCHKWHQTLTKLHVFFQSSCKEDYLGTVWMKYQNQWGTHCHQLVVFSSLISFDPFLVHFECWIPPFSSFPRLASKARCCFCWSCTAIWKASDFNFFVSTFSLKLLDRKIQMQFYWYKFVFILNFGFHHFQGFSVWRQRPSAASADLALQDLHNPWKSFRSLPFSSQLSALVAQPQNPSAILLEHFFATLWKKMKCFRNF